MTRIVLASASGISRMLVPAILLAGVEATAQQVIDLPGEDRPLALETEEVFSVGSLAGEEWETFSRIRGLAFDGQGNLYILDPDNFRVVKIGSDGSFRAELGGEGGGPGEFGMPFALAVDRDGVVGVFDLGYGGFVLFHPDGTFRRSVPMKEGLSVLPSEVMFAHPGGGILSGGGGGTRIRRGPGGGIDFPDSRPVHLFTLGDEVEADTVYRGWNPATAGGDPKLERAGSGGLTIQAPPMRAFDPELLVGVFPDGSVAVVDSTTYEVKVLDPMGGLLQRLRRPLFPREVTRQDREAERSRRLQEMVESGGPTIVMRTDRGTTRMASDQVRAMMESRIESMEFAPEMPVVAEMKVDWEGRVWIRRVGGQVGDQGPMDLIGLGGVYLGTLTADDLAMPDAFGPGGLAAFIELDELEVPRIVVRRLTLR